MNALDRLPPELRKPFSTITAGFGAIGFADTTLVDLVLDYRAKLGTDAPSPFFHAWRAVYRDHFPALSAIHAGTRVPFGMYDVVDYLASSCETIGESFAHLARYFSLVREGVEWTIEEDGALPTVRLVDRRAPDDYFFDEWMLGILFGRFRDLIGDHFRYTTCAVRRPRPDEEAVTKARDLLECEPTFGASGASFSVTPDVWSASLPRKNSRLRETLERHAAELLAEMAPPAETSRRVREVVTAELRGGEPTIERAAKRMAVTPRTLQRRLRDEGTSFQTLLDAVRADLAKRYLSDDRLGVTEVAFLLGYADASAFARAFRRWHGVAPAESRRS